MNHALTASAFPWKQLVVTTSLTLLAVVVLFTVNPTAAWFLPDCLFHRFTGLHCPGCGLTRATWHLLHGRVLIALHCNVLFTLALLGGAVVMLWRWFAPSQRRPTWKPVYTGLLLGAVLVFGVVRNIPVYPFTLLAPQEDCRVQDRWRRQ